MTGMTSDTTVQAEDIRQLNERIEKASAFVELLNLEMEKVIIGQKEMVEKATNWVAC